MVQIHSPRPLPLFATSLFLEELKVEPNGVGLNPKPLIRLLPLRASDFREQRINEPLA